MPLFGRSAEDGDGGSEDVVAGGGQLAGRPGARFAAWTGNMTSRSTLLRLLRAIEVPRVDAGPRVRGVDDFAIRCGTTYATIPLDMDSHRAIDVLSHQR